MEEVQLGAPRLDHELVLEDLAREVVSVSAAVALSGPAALLQDLLLIVFGLNSEAAVLQAAIVTELPRDASEHGPTQLPRVDGRFTRDAARA